MVTTKQMAKVDQLAVENGLLIMQMMEYAGLNTARFVQKFEKKKILILAGKGNNGGDGIAAARHLHNWGYEVKVILAEDPEELSETSKHHYNLIKKLKTPIKTWKNQEEWFKESELIIDGLLGYNIEGDPRAPYDTLIHLANNAKVPIVSIDLPSGLDGTKGDPYTPCIKANTTLTLALPKKGLFKDAAKNHVGKVYVADLGIPQFIFDEAGIKTSAFFEKNSIEPFAPLND